MILFPFIKPKKGKYSTMTFSTNWQQCSKQQQKMFVLTFLQPFYDIFDNIGDIFAVLFTNITNLGQAVTNVRVLFSHMAEELYTKMRDDYIRLAYIKNVFVRIFSKVFDGMYNLFYSVYYSYLTTRSFLSPLLPIANLFCFSPDTKITANKTIAEYKVGDTLPDNSQVLSTMVFTANKLEMYEYNSVRVAGSHLVFVPSTKKFERVEDVPTATKLPSSAYPYSTVICLRTSNNRITTLNGTKFADYDETSNPIINAAIQGAIIDNLNEKLFPYISPSTSSTSSSSYLTRVQIDKDASSFHHWAFHPDTEIDGKPISQYKIGDNLPSSHAKVTGIIKTLPYNVYLYKGVRVTGNQIVLDPQTNSYKRVEDIETAEQLTPSTSRTSRTSSSPPLYYNLTTTTGKIVINQTIFTDFEQSSDEDLNDAIDSLVNRYKNHEIPKCPSPYRYLAQTTK